MKKIFCLVLTLIMIAALAACGAKTTGSGTTATTASNKADTTETAASNKSDTAETAAADNGDTTETAAASSDGIDVDLTKMSSTMIYSEVQNMMMTPDKYVGKTVKASGAFSIAEIEDNRYFACVIKDATACCSQGLEFKWAGSHSYPADYPKEGAEITVTGTFSTYYEGEQMYCELKDADLQF